VAVMTPVAALIPAAVVEPTPTIPTAGWMDKAPSPDPSPEEEGRRPVRAEADGSDEMQHIRPLFCIFSGQEGQY
jgi:hypothetical protein